ncbi:response regulator [Sphingomonas sabuli]|uniref:histidine kinase n=1 Tax=Sphingomonas sabuli TaxID=2764186 RepID=A0A7G9L676_9SPHN|nr:histidine kinase dimerization/phosphoacceptor domain -containing protein [Sphingomonas sabuli]QNM84125.1 response regulator [Sphingomonas sabuli]
MSEPRILYVDDDDGLRRLIERAMGRRGFAVTTAASADEGTRLLEAGQFDLVAVDNHMPGKSGREMLAEIVAREDHPPVVFVTGNDDTSTAVEAIHGGALDFVVKTVGESFFDLLAGRFRQALTRDKLERDKRSAEAQLRVANEHLEMMVREVHHRVSNSLQMVLGFVAMQANQTGDAEVRGALDDIQNRIRAISNVHQRLYTGSDLATVDLHDYLRNLAGDLRDSLPQLKERVRLDVSGESIEVPTDVAISVGVIVNELVSNATKYAFAPDQGGTITVTLERVGEDSAALTVADDGVGLGNAQAPAGTGLGTRIVGAMARGLKSKVETLPTDSGTAQRLVIKLS